MREAILKHFGLFGIWCSDTERNFEIALTILFNQGQRLRFIQFYVIDEHYILGELEKFFSHSVLLLPQLAKLQDVQFFVLFEELGHLGQKSSLSTSVLALNYHQIILVSDVFDNIAHIHYIFLIWQFSLHFVVKRKSILDVWRESVVLFVCVKLTSKTLLHFQKSILEHSDELLSKLGLIGFV